MFGLKNVLIELFTDMGEFEQTIVEKTEIWSRGVEFSANWKKRNVEGERWNEKRKEKEINKDLGKRR